MLGRKPTLGEWRKAQDALADLPLVTLLTIPVKYAKAVREPEPPTRFEGYTEGDIEFLALETPWE